MTVLIASIGQGRLLTWSERVNEVPGCALDCLDRAQLVAIAYETGLVTAGGQIPPTTGGIAS